MLNNDLMQVMPLILIAVALALILPFLFFYRSLKDVPTIALWFLFVAILPIGITFLYVSVTQTVPSF